MRILKRTGRTVSVTGIGNHELPGLDIVTCAALLNTNHGKVTLIMHEYAYYGRGNTIHSPGQIEWFQNTCDNKSFHVGGKQVITFLDEYATPLQCRKGLMYMNLLGKPTDADLNTYPHVLLTGPHEWDPSGLDYTHPTTSGDPTWAPDPSQCGAHDPRIDEFGNFKGRVHHTLTHSPNISNIAQHKHAITTQPIDFEKLRPYFGWVNKHTIKRPFLKTTQWAVASTRYPMRKHFKSRSQAFNIPRRSEEVATDTIFSDTPAIDSGVTMAQIFVGKRTLVTDVYPLKSQKQFVNTLEDSIRFMGAMTKLISDYAKVEISNKVKDILRMYHSSSWNSEPYHQNQNPAKGRYCTLKSWTNTIMNRSGAPADCWLLCMIHASYILNHLLCEALAGNVPLGMLYGVSPDISIILLYTFYQPVFYAIHNQSYPSVSDERAACWVGFGEHVGDALTPKLLDDDTKKILYRSAVRPSDSSHPNKRLVPDGGESLQTPKPIIFVRSRQDDSQSATKPIAEYNPDDLIGRTFLLPKVFFQDHGKAQYNPKSRKVSNAPNGYQNIRVHLIFAVKHDGRHKARLVAGGHLTPDPIESIYSGVVSIRSLRLVIFLAKLNNLEVWGADIGNAYLEAKTKEKLYVVAGPEFEELEGHILVIYKALYGLKSSCLQWSQKIHDIMLDMGFSPCKADPCVWLRKAKCATKYEYVAIYVDDLLIACDCASEFIHTLKRKHNLKIKADGPLKYHLGCDYHMDPDGTLVAQSKSTSPRS